MSALRDALVATLGDWDVRLEHAGDGEPALLLESLMERSHS